MGTKNNPGKFDCYANAADDEPMFILLGRDQSAPYLVAIWIAIRQKKYGDALIALSNMVHSISKETSEDKLNEAARCAMNMQSFYAAKDMKPCDKCKRRVSKPCNNDEGFHMEGPWDYQCDGFFNPHKYE